MFSLRLLTFNLRYDNPKDGERSWSRRRAAVGEYLRQLKADLMAFQEVLPQQRQDLDRMLPDYRSYGISRDGQGRDEQCCWYVRDPWRLAEATTFWLSPTPQRVGRGWDAMLPRVCSLVQIRGLSGPAFWAANVHLDHAGPLARRQGLSLVANRLAGCAEPALLAGDFNEPDLWLEAPPLEGWSDCQRLAGQADLGTYHAFQGGEKGPRIDALLASPHWRLTQFQLDRRPELSDHYPLWAELEATEA